MIDRRRHPRRRACIPAVLAAGRVHLPCTIVDLSEGGAKVAHAAGFFFGAGVVLSAPDLGRAKPSRLVWRRRTESGIAFDD